MNKANAAAIGSEKAKPISIISSFVILFDCTGYSFILSPYENL